MSWRATSNDSVEELERKIIYWSHVAKSRCCSKFGKKRMAEAKQILKEKKK